jgi:2-oxoisovalerate dehydrogenase E1 component alpha subunit
MMRAVSVLFDLYAKMVTVRALNDDAIALQRQGVIYGFAPCTGQEAAQVGSAAALDTSRDFAFPTYREFGAMISLGVDASAVLAHHRGFADGGAFDSMAAHVAPINGVVGGTMLHATGWAMGAKLDADDGVALAYFGEGASSQGEAHEAMNFAGVFGLPVVFFCQNNGWAISLPASRQVAGGSVAARASGYGLPGVQIDGNDVVAVHDAVLAAVDRARAGEGATVIEALTYRVGPHATSDDPSRYRESSQEDIWRADDRDPIARARADLLAAGDADEDRLAEVDAEAEAACARVRQQLSAMEMSTLREQIDFTYAHPPAAFRDQMERWLAGVVHA